MNYISPVANEIAWHHAVEKLIGLELTPRCVYLRTILAEMMRLHDHLLNVGTTALDLGAFTAFLYAFEQREKIYDIVEYASGQRFHSSYTRVGGVLFDVNLEWVDRVRKFLNEIRPVYDEVDKLLPRNRIFIDRTKGITKAISYGATGRWLGRAAWCALRRMTVSAYPDLDFQGSLKGAGYARYLRGWRIREAKIIEQAIENLPAGPVMWIRRAIKCCRRNRRCTGIEGLIQHFEVLMPITIRCAMKKLRGQ